jgi:hypothetical protein
MKPFYKRLLAGALMLIIAGAAVAGIGYAIMRSKKGDTVMENQSYAAADVRSIQIDTDTPNVIITPVDGDQMNLSWQTDDIVEYRATLEGGVLSISYRIGSNWLKTIFVAPFAHNDYILEIELPNSFKGVLDVSTVSGKIIADTPASLDGCDLKSVSGVISAANIASLYDLTIRSTSGSVTADTIKAAGDIRIQTVSGGITTDRAEAGGAFSLTTTSGKAVITQIAAKGDVSLNSVSASLQAQDVSCAAFSAKSVSGGIHLQGIAADSMVLINTSGSIRGSISGKQGDYAISVSTVSGGSNLKNAAGSGGKTLKLSTVSGGIDLQFEGGN